MTMLADILGFEEGYEAAVYYDSLKYPTVGIGKKVGIQNAELTDFDFIMPESVAKFWLDYDLQDLQARIRDDAETSTAWRHCNEPRQDMLVSMAYQMGFEGLCEFQDMLGAIEIDDFEVAAREAIDSLWYRETPERARRESEVMRTGDYSPYDGLLT